MEMHKNVKILIIIKIKEQNIRNNLSNECHFKFNKTSFFLKISKNNFKLQKQFKSQWVLYIARI